MFGLAYPRIEGCPMHPDDEMLSDCTDELYIRQAKAYLEKVDPKERKFLRTHLIERILVC